MGIIGHRSRLDGSFLAHEHVKYLFLELLVEEYEQKGVDQARYGSSIEAPRPT